MVTLQEYTALGTLFAVMITISLFRLTATVQVIRQQYLIGSLGIKQEWHRVTEVHTQTMEKKVSSNHSSQDERSETDNNDSHMNVTGA